MARPSQAARSLIALGALRNQLRWLGYAIAIHFIVDLLAVVGAKRGGPLFGEIVAGSFAIASLVLISRLRGVDSVGPSPAPDASIDTTAQRT